MRLSYLVSRSNCYLKIGSKNLDALPLLIWIAIGIPGTLLFALYTGIPLQTVFFWLFVLTLVVLGFVYIIDYFDFAHYEIEEEYYLKLYKKIKELEELLCQDDVFNRLREKLKEIKKFIRDCLKQKGYLAREDLCIVENAFNSLAPFLKAKVINRQPEKENWKEKLFDLVLSE